MKSFYNLDLKGRCESHQCNSVESGQCTRIGSLYLIEGGSNGHTHIDNDCAPWEQHSCEEALQIDIGNGWDCTLIDGED